MAAPGVERRTFTDGPTASTADGQAVRISYPSVGDDQPASSGDAGAGAPFADTTGETGVRLPYGFVEADEASALRPPAIEVSGGAEAVLEWCGDSSCSTRGTDSGCRRGVSFDHVFDEEVLSLCYLRADRQRGHAVIVE